MLIQLCRHCWSTSIDQEWTMAMTDLTPQSLLSSATIYLYDISSTTLKSPRASLFCYDLNGPCSTSRYLFSHTTYNLNGLFCTISVNGLCSTIAVAGYGFAISTAPRTSITILSIRQCLHLLFYLRSPICSESIEDHWVSTWPMLNVYNFIQLSGLWHWMSLISCALQSLYGFC